MCPIEPEEESESDVQVRVVTHCKLSVDSFYKDCDIVSAIRIFITQGENTVKNPKV